MNNSELILTQTILI